MIILWVEGVVAGDVVVLGIQMLPILYNEACSPMQKALRKGKKRLNKPCSGTYLAEGPLGHLSSRQSRTAEHQQHMKYECGMF